MVRRRQSGDARDDRRARRGTTARTGRGRGERRDAGVRRRGRRDLPPEEVDDPANLVDADIEDSPAARALDELHWWLPDLDDAPPSEELADDLLDRFRDLAAVGAFRSVRDRVQNGDRFTVGSVDDLRARRRSVVQAVRTALDESDDRRLARAALANTVGRLEEVDRELDRYEGTVDASQLADEVGKYVAIAARARAVPDACAETLDALVRSSR